MNPHRKQRLWVLPVAMVGISLLLNLIAFFKGTGAFVGSFTIRVQPKVLPQSVDPCVSDRPFPAALLYSSLPALSHTPLSSESGKVWKFYLRPSLHFSNGSPIDSITVMKSLQRAANIRGVKPWESLEENESGVVMRLTKPSPDAPPSFLSEDPCYRIVAREDYDPKTFAWRSPKHGASSTAFRIQKIKKGSWDLYEIDPKNPKRPMEILLTHGPVAFPNADFIEKDVVSGASALSSHDWDEMHGTWAKKGVNGWVKLPKGAEIFHGESALLQAEAFKETKADQTENKSTSASR